MTVAAAPRLCPFCSGAPAGPTFPHSTLWRGRVFTYLRCSDCGTTYVDPVPSEADLADMYSKENYHDLYYEEARAEGAYVDSVTLLQRLGLGKRTILDFGCGSGSFMLAAAQCGSEVVGIEKESSAIENARTKTGLPVTTLEDALANGRRFEIVHLGDVIEHLPDPTSTLRLLERLLAPGGSFFVEGPLQANPSLVYYTSRLIRAVKRSVGLAAPATLAPTHLILTTAGAQRRFFTRTLGLRCTHFRVTESGWPYCAADSAPLTIPTLVRRTIGAAAVVAARVLPGWGNRFAAVLERP